MSVPPTKVSTPEDLFWFSFVQSFKSGAFLRNASAARGRAFVSLFHHRYKGFTPGSVNMGRRSVIFVISSFACLAWTSAHAAPLYLTDVFDPAADVFFDRRGAACTSSITSAECDSFEYWHFLSDFDAVTDVITDATLSLTFYDNNDNAAETVDIFLDPLSEGGITENNLKITSESTSSRAFAQLLLNLVTLVNVDGELQVSLARQNGSFYFAESTLTAHGERTLPVITPEETPPLDNVGGSANPSVPEPSSLLLLAGGAVAALVRSRRAAR
jgi:hypothetical protein